MSGAMDWRRRAGRWRGQALRRRLPDGTLGIGVRIGAGVVLDHPEQIRLGDGVILSGRCMVQCRPPSADHRPTITVGAKTFVNVNGIFVAGRGITIGEDVIFGPNVVVVDEDHVFDDPDVAIARQGLRSQGPIEIGDGAWVAAGAVVLGGTRIAPRSVVAAGAVVRGEFPERCVIAGVPAKVVRVL